MRSTSAASSPTSRGRSAGSRRSPGRRSSITPRLAPAPAQRETQSRTDQRVAAEQDRDRGVRGRGASARAATDRRSARGAAGPTRSGPRRDGQLPLVRARVGGRAAPGVSMMAASPRRREVLAEATTARRGPAGHPGREAGGRWPATLVRRPRSSTSARVRAAPALQPAQRPGRGPAGDHDLGPARRRRARTASSRVSTRSRSAADSRAGPSLAEQHEVERPVDVDAEPPSTPQVRDRYAGRLSRASAAARCRRAGRAGRAGRRRARRSPRRRPRTGCWPARPGRRAAAAATSAPRSAAVARADGPRTQDDQAPVADLRDDARSRRPNGVRRAAPTRPGPATRRPPGTRRDAVQPGPPGPATARASGPAAGPGSGWRMTAVTSWATHGPSLDGGTGATVGERRVRAYVGLGANVGDAPATLTWAVNALAGLPG